MAISFSGLASGLDTSSWVEALVSIKKQKITSFETTMAGYKTTKNVLNDTRSKVSSFRSALEKLTDAKFGGSFDLFNKNSVTSSNEDVFTATVTSKAQKQSYDIGVEQLATYTKATSRETASATIDNLNVKLSDLGVTSGDVTFFLGGYGKARAVKATIDENTTLSDLLINQLNLNADIRNIDGMERLSVMRPEGATFDVGATTDTSNFASIFNFEWMDDCDLFVASPLFKTSATSKLTDENAGFKSQITEGTFTIGNAEFTIDENTTLSSLISQINSNEDAQAYAHWDSTAGKLSITSKVEGASYINIEAGTSNFTDVMQLTNGNKLYTDAQELGNNAIFTVNGTRYISHSNTVTSDISRIEGLTLNLKSVSPEDETTSKLEIKQDTSDLIEAVKSFVSSYNDLVSNIDSVTAAGKELHGESGLTGLRNTLRSYVNGANESNGGIYKTLAEIGISVASANASNLDADVTSISFDESKFLEALANDTESVKSILAGDNGILNMMESSVEQVLTAASGYFDIKTSTLDTNIKRMEDKIKSQNSRIETYKAQLEKKFKAMEQMITSMQQNYSSFLSSGT